MSFAKLCSHSWSHFVWHCLRVKTKRITILNSRLNSSVTYSYKRKKKIHMGIFSSKSVSPEMSAQTTILVKDLIKSDVVVIFSKSYCPYCKLAKEVFDKMQTKYTAIELDTRTDAEEIQKILGEITGARTVPRVFVNGECLGGGTDVKALYESGKLQQYFE